MKTDQLVDLLARGAGPAPAGLPLRRLAPVALAGVVLSTALAVGLLGALPANAYGGPAPWVKLAYAGALAAAAGWLVARLGQPGTSVGLPLVLVLAVTAAMALLGLASTAATPVAERARSLLGHSWATCPWSVLALSLPALAGAIWALRGLAPTRPRVAGLAAGLFAGAVGAFGYAFSCTESALGFVALWYTLGIALSGALGALVGPRFLRW